MKEIAIAISDKINDDCTMAIILLVVIMLISYHSLVKIMLAYCRSQSTKKGKR